MDDPLYEVARQVTDAVMGHGTYDHINNTVSHDPQTCPACKQERKAKNEHEKPRGPDTR